MLASRLVTPHRAGQPAVILDRHPFLPANRRGSVFISHILLLDGSKRAMINDADLKQLTAGRWLIAADGAFFAPGRARASRSCWRGSGCREARSRRAWRNCRRRAGSARNPGHGHPLRPEYVLTARGEPIAAFAVRVMAQRGAARPGAGPAAALVAADRRAAEPRQRPLLRAPRVATAGHSARPLADAQADARDSSWSTGRSRTNSRRSRSTA